VSLLHPILNHTRVASRDVDPTSWLYLLHGIYGSGRNWGNLARRLVQERPEWGVILVDLRLHGGSVGFEPPHTLRACAEDVARLERDEGAATAIVGHSFGGKVALLRAADPAEALSQVWVIDSTLRTGEPTGSAWEIIDIVRGLPPIFESREQVVDELERRGYGRGVGQWLAMNLERSGDGFRWRLDWDGVEGMLRSYFATDVWGTIEGLPGSTHLHVVRANDSAAIDPVSERRLVEAGERTGRVHLHRLAGGHWINVDNPDGMLELLVNRLG